MSVKLRNRKAMEGSLGSFINRLAVPPQLVHGILHPDLDDVFQVPRSLLNPWV